MRQVNHNAELSKLVLDQLDTVKGYLLVRARRRPCSADRARAAARIAPSLPCFKASARPRVRQVNDNAKLAKLVLDQLETVKGDLVVRVASPALG